jgi:hypothetical protein
MATAVDAQPSGLVAVSRAVVSAAAELAATVERAVVGDDRVRTARGNAYEAFCADRARAQARDEMDALVRSLLAVEPRAAAHPAPHVPHAPHPAATRRRATPRRRSADLVSAGPAAGR